MEWKKKRINKIKYNNKKIIINNIKNNNLKENKIKIYNLIFNINIYIYFLINYLI